MKFLSLFFTIIYILSGYINIHAASKSSANKIIRVAIIDNFHFQPFITNNFSDDYLPGIEAAIYFAQKKGYDIKYHLFTYPHDPLAVLSITDEVNAWHPDVILGPRNSNTFLLLKDKYKDIFVLSPFATSPLVSKMPDNFYSLTRPDQYVAKAIAAYSNKYLKNHGVYAIIEASCKNCMDIGKLFKNYYLENNKELKMKYFSQNNVKSLNIEELLDEYKPNQAILLPNTSYASAVLMTRITNYNKKPTIFLGGDDWGNWRHTLVGKLHANTPYYGLHFTPWSFHTKGIQLKNFIESYRYIYKRDPNDTAAYISFTSIISIITALERYDNTYKLADSMKFKILKSYKSALTDNPNWFRPNTYAIYQVNESGERFIGEIKVPEELTYETH